MSMSSFLISRERTSQGIVGEFLRSTSCVICWTRYVKISRSSLRFMLWRCSKMRKSFLSWRVRIWSTLVFPCVFESRRVVNPWLSRCVVIRGKAHVACCRSRWVVSVEKSLRVCFSLSVELGSGVLQAFRERIRAALSRSARRCLIL